MAITILEGSRQENKNTGTRFSFIAMQVCLLFMGPVSADIPEMKMEIPDTSISVADIVEHLRERLALSDTGPDEVKIICNGVLLDHRCTLAACRWDTTSPLFYSFPQVPVRLPSFLDFSTCATAREALVAIAAAATHLQHPFTTRDALSQTCLHHACIRFQDADVVRRLIEEGSDVNALDYDGFSPLFYAQSAGVVEQLLRARANPNVVSKKETPLHCAVSAEAAETLLSANADLTARDTRGVTLLHRARSPAMARWFLRKGLKNAAAVDPLSLEHASPIETVIDFQTAVVLYEAGGSFPVDSFSKLRERPRCGKGRVNERAARRVEEFRRFDCRLAIAGMCRGSAFATAFRHPFAAHATFSRPVAAQCLSAPCLLSDAADGGGSDDVWPVGRAASFADALYRGRFVGRLTACLSPRVFFAKKHRLRCGAGAGLAGVLVRRLFHQDGSISPMHAQFVVRRSTCTALALALHLAAPGENE